MAGGNIFRALRVVEFIGTREFLDRQTRQSSWSEWAVRDGVIKAGWIGATPGPVDPEVQAEEALRQVVERRRDAAMDFVNAVADGGHPNVTMEYLKERAAEIQRMIA